MRYKVFDLEITKDPKETGGWDRTDLMEIACCVVYDNEEDSFRVYGERQREEVIESLQDSDLVVSFNGIEFDWRILLQIAKDQDPRAHLPLAETKQFDIYREIKEQWGLDKYQKGYALKNLAEANLKSRKTRESAEAPILWSKGFVLEVVDYCINDVKITRDLFRHIQNYGYLIDPVKEKPYLLTID